MNEESWSVDERTTDVPLNVFLMSGEHPCECIRVQWC